MTFFRREDDKNPGISASTHAFFKPDFLDFLVISDEPNHSNLTCFFILIFQNGGRNFPGFLYKESKLLNSP